jgi:capsular polysaccharide biosynthesis protein
VRALLLDVSRRNDLSREMQPFAEVLEAFRRQGVIVVLPGESGLEEAARGQGLAGFDDL